MTLFKQDYLDVVDAEGRVHPLLRELAQVTGITDIPYDLPTFVTVTQQHWLRGACERWDVDPEKWIDRKSQIEVILEKIGVLKPSVPSQLIECDYLLVHGTEAQPFASRLKFAASLLRDQLVNPRKVIVLTGNRALIPREHDYMRSLGAKLRSEAHEFNIACLLCEQDAYKASIGMRSMKIVLARPEAEEKRATTVSTLRRWFNYESFEKGRVVAISSVPFIPYQDATLRLVLPLKVQTMTLGTYEDEPESLATCLDAVARWLYQENLYQKRQLRGGEDHL